MSLHVRVVKGEPTDEELAAVIAVLTNVVAKEASKTRPVSTWQDNDRKMRTPSQTGFSGWRNSALAR